ncbi:testis-specific H1 histone-like [Palaemon carinicauda]|uniref:testis-specific H1 histone-like n=1 Tax=Palaemon carinicauda TaxID=392227 RepID=UPI0035B5F87C
MSESTMWRLLARASERPLAREIISARAQKAACAQDHWSTKALARMHAEGQRVLARETIGARAWIIISSHVREAIGARTHGRPSARAQMEGHRGAHARKAIGKRTNGRPSGRTRAEGHRHAHARKAVGAEESRRGRKSPARALIRLLPCARQTIGAQAENHRRARRSSPRKTVGAHGRLLVRTREKPSVHVRVTIGASAWKIVSACERKTIGERAQDYWCVRGRPSVPARRSSPARARKIVGERAGDHRCPHARARR